MYRAGFFILSTFWLFHTTKCIYNAFLMIGDGVRVKSHWSDLHRCWNSIFCPRSQFAHTLNCTPTPINKRNPNVFFHGNEKLSEINHFSTKLISILMEINRIMILIWLWMSFESAMQMTISFAESTNLLLHWMAVSEFNAIASDKCDKINVSSDARRTPFL